MMQKKQIALIFIIVLVLISLIWLSLNTLKEAKKNTVKNITTTSETQKRKTLKELTVNSKSNCGYEYFIKKKDGSYEYLPEEIFNFQNKITGTASDASSTEYFNFMNSLVFSIPDDVVSALNKSTSSSYADGIDEYKSSHPQDTLSVAIYTSGCLNATNTPNEYYTPKNIQINKTDEQNDLELVAVIHKADTVAQLEKNIFDKDAVTMNCQLVSSFSKENIVNYVAESSLSSIDDKNITDLQKKLLIKIKKEIENSDSVPSYCGSIGYYDSFLQNKSVAPKSFIQYIKPSEVPYWSEKIIVN